MTWFVGVAFFVSAVTIQECLVFRNLTEKARIVHLFVESTTDDLITNSFSRKKVIDLTITNIFFFMINRIWIPKKIKMCVGFHSDFMATVEPQIRHINKKKKKNKKKSCMLKRKRMVKLYDLTQISASTCYDFSK